MSSSLGVSSSSIESSTALDDDEDNNNADDVDVDSVVDDDEGVHLIARVNSETAGANARSAGLSGYIDFTSSNDVNNAFTAFSKVE